MNSGIVGAYREFIHQLVQMLHLPRLPQYDDMLGFVMFSISRGYWIANGAFERYWQFRGEVKPSKGVGFSRFPLLNLAKWFAGVLEAALPISLRSFGRIKGKRAFYISPFDVALDLVYGTAVAIVIAALFGIDYRYRHFA